jgi:hypothetical protein
VSAKNKTVQVLGIAPDGSRVAFNFSLGAWCINRKRRG